MVGYPVIYWHISLISSLPWQHGWYYIIMIMNEYCEQVCCQRGGRRSNAPPIFFLPPPYFFGRSCCSWAEKTLKFVISARKSLWISAKTFFFFLRSRAFNRKICDFGQKKPSHFSENLCPPDFNFAPPISRSWRRP